MIGGASIFPPRLESVELDDVGARWNTLPFGPVQFRVQAATRALFIDVTPSWLDLRKSFHTDFDVPGFQASWRIDPASPRRRSLSLDDQLTSTSFAYDVPGR